jgi:hypothetical protein
MDANPSIGRLSRPQDQSGVSRCLVYKGSREHAASLLGSIRHTGIKTGKIYQLGLFPVDIYRLLCEMLDCGFHDRRNLVLDHQLETNPGIYSRLGLWPWV